jgi:hypothetical protein
LTIPDFLTFVLTFKIEEYPIKKRKQRERVVLIVRCQ